MPAAQFALSGLAAILDRGYEGYLVPIAFTEDSVDRTIGADGIDLASSYIIENPSGEPFGVMLVARRGQVSRLATLGVRRSHRGKALQFPRRLRRTPAGAAAKYHHSR